MGIKTGFRYIISVVLIFMIAVACVIMFHTCMQQYQPYVPPVVDEEPSVVEPEPVAQPLPVVEPEPVVEITEPVKEPEPITEPEPVVEPIVEPIIEPEPIEEPVEEPVVEPEPIVEPEPVEVELTVPDVPDLDLWVDTYVYEEVENWDYSMFYEDIDWSQFVFSDEEIVLPDGTYYAQLFVNDNTFGMIELEILNGDTFFKKSAIASELNGTLADDYYEEFTSLDKAYYTLEDFTELGAEVNYDSTNLYLYLYFNSSQVPIQTLSMGNASSYSLLRQSYNVEGNIELEPANFSFASNISAFVYTQYDKQFNFRNVSLSLSFANTISFWNMTISLPTSLTISQRGGLIPSIGNWYGFIDFPTNNIRFSFGNVGNAGFANGTPFGVTIEKNYSYGTGNAMGNQYSQTITLVEDSLVDIKVNGTSVYTRNLALGVYRLTDFAFIQGANQIEVTIHPLRLGDDTSEDQVLFFDQSYDSSLIAKGESTWRIGASIPKLSITGEDGVPTDTMGFLMPTLPRYEGQSAGWKARQYMYVLSDYSIFFEQSIGLSHIYSQSHSLAMVVQRKQNGQYDALFNMSVSGTLATAIGTSRATVVTSLNGGDYTKSTFSFTISQNFVNPKLKPLSLSGSYSRNYTMNTFTLNTGYSFDVMAARMSVSANLSLKTRTQAGIANGTINDKPFTGSLSLSLSTALGKKTTFSLSSSVNQDLYVYATASLSVSLGSGSSTNASVSGGFDPNGIVQDPVANVSLYYRPKNNNRNSFQFNVSNIQFHRDALKDFTYSGTWSHSGGIYSMSLRQQITNTYLSTSVSLNTALAFADGSFAMTNSIYGPFLIVSPEKSLKGADISISSATDSNTQVSKKTLGNVLYSNLSMYKGNNVVVYASTGSLFSSSGSFLFKLTPVARQGFLAKVKLETSQTISGALFHTENSVYDTYSSPIYRVTLKDNGRDVEKIEIDNTIYLFTDIDGRFILSDIKPGVYMFDLDVNGKWYAAFFEVEESLDGKVSLLKNLYSQEIIDDEDDDCKYNIMTCDDTYAGQTYMAFDQKISEEDFWAILFSITDEDYGWDTWSAEDEYWDSLDMDLTEYQTVEFDGDNASLVNAAP